MDNSRAVKIFLKKLTLQFLILGLLCAAVFILFVQQHYFSFVPIIFLYFYILNTVVFYILTKSYNLPIIKFTNRFMVITTAKLFSSLVFAVLFMVFAKEHIIPFLVIFIILYFLSLFQLVREFLHFLNQKKVE
jgi:hypothetical protein